ncbi:MAG: hypothetical protein DID91_2727704678 [Candidatus Nitrotoga sp. MKT]|nr:MAG: hypothetical protein DID91_2727704678 [Candidatus Nitrotoga sp. MKT]
MLLFKTSKNTLPAVIKHAKHALMQCPHAEPGEIILIAQTRDDLLPEQKPIRYRMELLRIYKDNEHESQRIWGRPWTYIVEGYNCIPLKTPFDINEVQITERNYQQGGTFFHVDPKDVLAIVGGRYLEVAL